MANFTPAQHEAIYNLSTNLIVSAGAGAGKTRVLVERYIYILQKREAACDEILAITFTNKAAKEMKERIRGLAAVLAENPEADEAEQLYWGEIKNSLEYALIGTFHSFCARVLRENPVEAALDPNFAVLDEFEAATVMDKVLTGVLETALTVQAPWLERLFRIYDKPLLVENVIKLYDSLLAEGLLTSQLEECLNQPYLTAVAKSDTIKDKLRQLCGELFAFKANLKPGSAHYTLVEWIENNWPEVDKAIENTDRQILDHYLGGLSARSKDKEIVNEIKETLKTLNLIEADQQALGIVPDLCKLLLSLKVALDKYKVEHRVLTFNDMEVRTVTLLKNNPAVCGKYHKRIRRIMVDEFQDTNDLQRQIIYLLAGGDAEQLLGNKLFVVGDAKQSIYRFRGADVAVFDRVRRDIIASGGKPIELDINFRSMDGLLAIFNECFAAIMGTAADQVKFCQLAGHRQAVGEDEPRAEFLAIPKANLLPGQLPREAEASAIARRIRAMVDNRERLVNHDVERRNVCYGDIAILFRVASDIDVYAAALKQAGVPYYIVGGRGFFRCQEVLDVLNLLRVVENRYQETALAGVLRSPMFLLADDTLVLLKNHGKDLWQGLENYASLDQLAAEDRFMVERAWQVLTYLRGFRGIIRPTELLRRALAKTGYLSFVLTQFMGEQKYANLVKLMSMAANLETKGLTSLGDFIRQLSLLVEDDAKEGEAQIESESGDTVRLMTIHKAKGLEFPVVFIPDLNRKFNSDSAPMVVGAGKIGIKVPDKNGLLTFTSVYQTIAADAKRLEYLELKRVMYVAFTRAKDYLVLSAVAEKAVRTKDYTELSNWLDWLGKVYAFDDFNELPERLAVDEATIIVKNTEEFQAGYDSLPAAHIREAAAAVSLEFIKQLEYQMGAIELGDSDKLILSPSDIIQYRKCQRSFYYKKIVKIPDLEINTSESTGDYEELPGNLIGSAFHRVLELLEPDDEWQQWVNQAVEELVPSHREQALKRQVVPLVERYLTSQLGKRLLEFKILKEWPFFFSLPNPDYEGEDYLFRGVVDCLVFYPDGTLGIVDYKTDNITVEQTPARAKEHSLQLVLYAVAAELVLGRTVKDVKVYFARLGITVDILLTAELRQAVMAETVAVCRHGQQARQENDFACNREWCGYCEFGYFCPKV
ncbi:MAG: addA [Firmicutes bacterium]|nr:addA [Bacillota bacterium]